MRVWTFILAGLLGLSLCLNYIGHKQLKKYANLAYKYAYVIEKLQVDYKKCSNNLNSCQKGKE